jgi:hypothetical protein
LNLISRIIFSLILGAIFYALILVAAFRFPIVIVKAPFLLWNVKLFSFVGRGDPVGYMPNGDLIYGGMTGFLGMSWANILLGFVIYPLIIFVFLTSVDLIIKRKKG